MALTTISGSGYRNNGGTLFTNGANSNLSSLFDTLTERQSAYDVEKTGPISGQAGCTKAYSAGTFNYNAPGTEMLVRGVSTTVNGVASDKVRLTGSDFYNMPIAYYRGQNRYHITGYNYLTHALTYGGSRGTVVKLINNAGSEVIETYPTGSVPAEFVITTGSPNPSQVDYPITNA